MYTGAVLMVSTLEKHLEKIDSLGARKFVVIGTGPVGCCPLQRNDLTGECNEQAKSMSEEYSKRLKSVMQDLRRLKLHDVVLGILTLRSALFILLLKQKGTCLLGLSPSYRGVYRIIVDELFYGSKYTVPMNVKELAFV